MQTTVSSTPRSGMELTMPRLLSDDGTIVACLRRFMGSRTVIGGCPSADLYIAHDPLIALAHTCITWDDAADTHVIHDCGTSSGTWLDGMRLRRPTRLVNGARIGVGTTELVYCRRLPMPGYVSSLARRVRPLRRVGVDWHQLIAD